jgi:hypothetical protein
MSSDHDLDEAYYLLFDNIDSLRGIELLELKKAIEDELEKRDAQAQLEY